MIRLLTTIIIICFSVIFSEKSFAQNSGQQPVAYKGVFSLDGKITLDSLTKCVHHLSGMRFSFNSSKVKGSKEIYFPKGTYSFTQLLERIKKTTSLYYTFYQGYVVFQDNPPKQQSVQVKKNSAAQKINPGKKNIGAAKKEISRSSEKKNEKNPLTDTISKVQTISVSPDNGLLKSISSDSTRNATTNNQTTSAQVPNIISPTVPPVNNNSSARDTASKSANRAPQGKEGKNSKPLKIHFGLQWNINLPLYGTENYFTGINGKSQPHNFLIPAIWVSKIINNESEILLQAVPQKQFFGGNKTLTVYTGPRSPTDTFGVKKITALSKTISFVAGIQYNYYFNERWGIGAGINYHWQNKALLKQEISQLSDGKFLSDSLFGITKSSAEWRYLESSFITGRLELSYRFGKWQTGASVLLPFTNMSSLSASNIRPLNGQLFLRWRIK